MRHLILIVACTLAACGGRPTERVVGVVIAVESDSSFIIEMAAGNFPKMGTPISDADITLGGDPHAVAFKSGPDGKFEISTIGEPPTRKGSPRSLSVSAPGYTPANIQYLSFPNREAQYFLVLLKRES